MHKGYFNLESSTIGLASDDVTKHSNAWQRGKLVLNKVAPIQKHAGEKVSHWAKFFIPLWRGLNGFDNSVTFQKISGIGQLRGRFSVDRRSARMLLFGTLSLFRTNFAGCYASCCGVRKHFQALWLLVIHQQKYSRKLTGERKSNAVMPSSSKRGSVRWSLRVSKCRRASDKPWKREGGGGVQRSF